MSYEMRGLFLEACDCNVICPCWFHEPPDGEECTGLMLWYVEKGEVNGVDVSGLSVASVSHHQGHRESGGHDVQIFVDEGASPEQERALWEVFSGKLGGPLAELDVLSASVQPPRRVPITYQFDGGRTKVSVGYQVIVEMAPLVGALNRVTTLADSAMGKVLGSLAEVGKSSRFLLNLNRPEFDKQLEGKSANRGRFSYRFAET